MAMTSHYVNRDRGLRLDRRSVAGGLCAAGLFSAAPRAGLAAAPLSAAETLKAELAAADAEGKTLALFAQASWCPYCKLFGILLNESAAAPVLKSYFRFFWLNVRERKPEWKAKELSGAMALFKYYSGGQQSVPFFAFLDKEGKTLSASVNASGQNIGYPTSDAELGAFDAMFAKAAPAMTNADIARVRAALVSLYSPKD